MNLFLRIVWIALLAGVARVAAAEPQLDIEYGRAGGESLKLDAWVPDGAGPFAAVILVHGGGWTAGDKSGGPRKALIAPMHEPLQRAGLAWFSINYRLAPAHRYPACIEDVETAIRWVKTHAAQYRVDPRRIAIAGESAGAHLAGLAVVRADESTRLAAAVLFYGVFDLPLMTTPGAELRTNFVALFDRKVADEPTLALLRAASPLHQVKAGLPPFLLVHGSADQRVPIEQSQRLHARLQEARVPCELLTIAGGDHGMAGWEKVSRDYKERVAAWIARTLAAPSR